MKTNKYARLVRRIKGFRGDARLYALSEPVEYQSWVGGIGEGRETKETRHVVVSAGDTHSGPESFIFPSDADGVVLNWGELEGSIRGVLDHEAALDASGYELINYGLELRWNQRFPLTRKKRTC